MSVESSDFDIIAALTAKGVDLASIPSLAPLADLTIGSLVDIGCPQLVGPHSPSLL